MFRHIAYFQDQINFIKEIHSLLQQAYDYSATDLPEVKELKEINQLLKIKQACENQAIIVHDLEKKVELLQNSDKFVFNSLSADIGLGVEKLLSELIDLGCPESLKNQFKKQYSSYLGKTFQAIKAEELSSMNPISNVADSNALVNFRLSLSTYTSQLKIAFLQEQKRIERQLPDKFHEQLNVVRAGNFRQLPKDVIEHMSSFLDPRTLCKLSETGLFFSKLTKSRRDPLRLAFSLKTATNVFVNLVGDWGSGLRSLVHRLAEEKYLDSHPLQVKKSSYRNDKKYGKFLLNYETPPLQGLQSLRNNITPLLIKQYCGDKILLVCFDIGSRESFEHVTFWIKEVQRYNENARLLIVGLKSDVTHRAVTQEEANELAFEWSMDYLEVSAKEGVGLNDLEAKIVEIYAINHNIKTKDQKEESKYVSKP